MIKPHQLSATIALVLAVMFTFTARASAQALSGSLWYNGDLNGVNGLSNESNTSLGAGEFGSVYDDFNVTGSGWTITAVYSNDLMSNTTATGATWEIRSGVSAGNGGTLVASGSTMSPVVTSTGRSFSGLTEYTVEVTGLNVTLAAGTYWLNVTPSDSGTGRSFISNTSGFNSVGTPGGNDMNAFFNSNFFGANFGSTADQGQPSDFSEGVVGTNGSVATPEAGSTLALLGCALGALVAARRYATAGKPVHLTK
jgi:hypothetical protein